MKINKKIIIIFITLFSILIPFAWFIFKAQKREQEKIVIQPSQQVYKSTDIPTFYLDISNQPILSAILNLQQSVYAEESNQNTYTEENLQINAKIINPTYNYELATPLQIQKQQVDKYVITASDPTSSLIPGKYSLEVEVIRSGENTKVTQDFNWGVLALNTNKSVYKPNETAIISMAVLDDLGDMVCDADVLLEITDQNGEKTSLSTQNDQIIVSPNCKKKEFIEEPDYKTSFTFNEIGGYNFVLTAITPNGSYSISDIIEVVEYVPFDIERTTATRIYPPLNYPVKINIKANEDFEGTILEQIPAQFEVMSAQSGYVSNLQPAIDSDSHFVKAVQYTLDVNDVNIVQDKNTKKLTWNVNFKKGDEYQIIYTYKAPEISPEFYLIGQLIMIEKNKIIFEEHRQWQIASDAVAWVSPIGTGSVGNGTTASGSLAVDAGNLVVVTCTTLTSKTLTFDGVGYTNVYAASGAPTQYTWYKIATATGTESLSCSWSGKDGGTIIIAEFSGVETSTGYILDTNASATGSGDTTVECPSVTPSSGNHLYVSGLAFAANTNISTWSNTFTEIADVNVGNPNPTLGAMAYKASTGAQSTTATAGTSGAWRCHTLAFNEEFDLFTGRVFTDDNESAALGSVSVCGVVNAGTPQCITNDTSGYFTLVNRGLDGVGGDELTFFIDGGTYLANTKSVSDGGDIVSADNLRLYQNHLILRSESGANIRIVDIDLYDNDQNSTDMLYDAEIGPSTLSVETPYELFIPAGYTFTPEGSVSAVHDIEIDGVWTATTTETVNLSGTYKLDVGGTLNPANSTVTFNGTGGTEDVITDGTGKFYNLQLNDGGNNLTIEVEDPLNVLNTLSISNGTLDVKSGENNQINVGNWDNDDTFYAQSGSIVFDGSGSVTYTIDGDGTGTDAFWDVTFNDGGGANNATYQLTALLDVDNDLTITGGTLNSNANTIYIGRNWTNSDIFTEGTATVIFDGNTAGTLNSGCSDVSTCTNQNFYNLILNKKNALTVATTGLRLTNTLTLTAGELIQTTTDIRAEGATAVSIEEPGRWTNISTGDVYLGGNLYNAGVITFNANGYACGDADDITLTSTAGQRTWTGTGAIRMTDVNVANQTGSYVIHAGSSTNGGSNGANWIFLECNLFEFNGLNFDGIKID